MAENCLIHEVLSDKGAIPLVGDPAAATENLRDYLATVFNALDCHLALVDDIATNNDAARSTAMVGAALLRQANWYLDHLHDLLRQAGIGLFVGAEGKAWEPGRVTAMALKALPGKVEVVQND